MEQQLSSCMRMIELLQLQVRSLCLRLEVLEQQQELHNHSTLQSYADVSHTNSTDARRPALMGSTAPSKVAHASPAAFHDVDASADHHNMFSRQLEDELQRMGLDLHTNSGPSSPTAENDGQRPRTSMQTSSLFNGAFMEPTSMHLAATNPAMAGAQLPARQPINALAMPPMAMAMNMPPPGVAMMPFGTVPTHPNNNNTNNNNNGSGKNNNNNNNGDPALTLDPATSTNEVLQHACAQMWMKALCLKNCRNISDFSPISRLKTLWKLNLQGCSQYVDDQVVLMIANNCRNLSRLNLCGCELITDGSPLSLLPYLFDLNVSGTQVRDIALELLSARCPQLSRLAINSCTKITSVECVSKFSELRLLYCRYAEHIMPTSIAAMLASMSPNLVTLNLDGIRFSSLHFNSPPSVSGLRNLTMRDNLDLTSLAWLVDGPIGPSFANLESLDLDGCSNLVNLANIHALTNLKMLRLCRTMVDDAQLMSIAKLPSLQTLALDGCSDISHVECLSGSSTLNRLILDASMQIHAQMLHMALPNLRNRIEFGDTKNDGGGGDGCGGAGMATKKQRNNNNNNNNMEADVSFGVPSDAAFFGSMWGGGSQSFIPQQRR